MKTVNEFEAAKNLDELITAAESAHICVTRDETPIVCIVSYGEYMKYQEFKSRNEATSTC